MPTHLMGSINIQSLNPVAKETVFHRITNAKNVVIQTHYIGMDHILLLDLWDVGQFLMID